MKVAVISNRVTELELERETGRIFVRKVSARFRGGVSIYRRNPAAFPEESEDIEKIGLLDARTLAKLRGVKLNFESED